MRLPIDWAWAALRHADKNNFAPRLGFSYRLDREGKTALRGGWGVYYSHYSGNVPGDLSRGPFAATTVMTNSIVNGAPLFTLANPFSISGTPGTVSLAAVAPRLLNSYAQQYSLSLERELTHSLGLRVSYIGSKGTQLPYRRDVNQPQPSTAAFSNARRPYPLFSTINYADNGANMLYGGLQTGVQKRFSRGLMFSSTWTWAKELSDTDDTDDFELNTTIEDTYNRRRDRGNVYSVPRHQWLNQAIYELPLGRGPLLSGWQIDSLIDLSRGNWFTPLISGPDPTNTNQTTLRPDVNGPIAYPHTVSAWFNPSVFTTPANGNWGNAGRGIIQGPGYVLFNLGLQKSVRLEKAGMLQFVASFQNVLNHVNLGGPPREVVRCPARWSSTTPTAARSLLRTSFHPPVRRAPVNWASAGPGRMLVACALVRAASRLIGMPGQYAPFPICSARHRHARERLVRRSRNAPLEMNQANEQARQRAAYQWPGNRHGGVPPVRRIFLRNRQQRVNDARSQVARRIDGVSGGAAQAQADAPNHAAHQVRSQTCRRSRRRHSFGEYRARHQHQHERADDFAH